jgi:hypothetical protein
MDEFLLVGQPRTRRSTACGLYSYEMEEVMQVVLMAIELR